MSSQVRFPFEVILNISNILLLEESFLELETIIYNFPQLKKHFSYRFPTIAIVNTDQYDKYSKFIHTRERPFGSRDLFIIKHKGSRSASKLKSKCYMILGSERNFKRVREAFQLLDFYVTLKEIKKISGLSKCDGSYKCYELVCEPQEDDERVLRSAGYLSSFKHYSHYTFHVTFLAETFLEAISPFFLRFESYFGDYDLSLGYDEIYPFYHSLRTFRGFVDDSQTWREQKDHILKSIKCSFEFVKDLENLERLYQYLLKDGIKFYTEHRSDEKRWSKWRIWNSWFKNNEKVNTISLFRNVKDITIDKIMIEKAAINGVNIDQNFILIDCSRSATRNTNTYEFIINHYSYGINKVPRLNTRAASIKLRDKIFSNEELGSKAGLSPSQTGELADHIVLLYKDFLAEQLESVDITAFSSPLDPRFIDERKPSFKSLNEPNLKDLECQINRLLEFITRLGNTKGAPQSKKITELSHRIISTIINEIPTFEGLNNEQPLRLRVFQKHSDSINRADEIFYRKEWFRHNMC